MGKSYVHPEFGAEGRGPKRHTVWSLASPSSTSVPKQIVSRSTEAQLSQRATQYLQRRTPVKGDEDPTVDRYYGSADTVRARALAATNINKTSALALYTMYEAQNLNEESSACFPLYLWILHFDGRTQTRDQR